MTIGRTALKADSLWLRFRLRRAGWVLNRGTSHRGNRRHRLAHLCRSRSGQCLACLAIRRPALGLGTGVVQLVATNAKTRYGLDKTSRIRLAAGMWLTAAALAFAAAVLTYTRRGEIRVELLAAAVFL